MRLQALALFTLAVSSYLLLVKRLRPGLQRLWFVLPLLPVHMLVPLVFDWESEVREECSTKAMVFGRNPI